MATLSILDVLTGTTCAAAVAETDSHVFQLLRVHAASSEAAPGTDVFSGLCFYITHVVEVTVAGASAFVCTICIDAGTVMYERSMCESVIVLELCRHVCLGHVVFVKRILRVDRAAVGI